VAAPVPPGRHGDGPTWSGGVQHGPGQGHVVGDHRLDAQTGQGLDPGRPFTVHTATDRPAEWASSTNGRWPATRGDGARCRHGRPPPSRTPRVEPGATSRPVGTAGAARRTATASRARRTRHHRRDTPAATTRSATAEARRSPGSYPGSPGRSFSSMLTVSRRRRRARRPAAARGPAARRHADRRSAPVRRWRVVVDGQAVSAVMRTSSSTPSAPSRRPGRRRPGCSQRSPLPHRGSPVGLDGRAGHRSGLLRSGLGARSARQSACIGAKLACNQGAGDYSNERTLNGR